jgi:uncharacterized membrane protein
MGAALLYSKGVGAFADFLISVMRAVGYGICHQMPARSLHFGGRALPVCARDTGIFIGFAVCFIALAVAYRGKSPSYPSWPKMAVLAAFILPTAVDAVTSYAGWRVSSNALRLVTGSLAGTAVAAFLFPLTAGCLQRLRGREASGHEVRLLEPAWSLPTLLVLPAAVSLALWPDWPGAFSLWAPLVTLSILFVLLCLNCTLVALIFEWVGRRERAHTLALVVSIGVVLALVELVASNRLHWLVDRLL